MIYTITAVPEAGNGYCRCLGYFMSFEAACKEIDRGLNGLDEAGLYDYLVIEEFSSGIYAHSLLKNQEWAETWFEADYATNKWKQIEKPQKFRGTTNYGMG